MINKRGFRRVAVFASVAAITGGAVAGCGSNAATATGAGTGTATQEAAQPPQGGRIDVTALAKTLGVTSAKLQAAMDKTRPQQGQAPGSGGDRAAALAKELGLSESKVQAALDKVMPQGGGPRGAGNGQPAPSSTSAAGATSS
jgi:hypothetical protein